jgi:hypothetical protein
VAQSVGPEFKPQYCENTIRKDFEKVPHKEMTNGIECLSSMYKVLHSISSTVWQGKQTNKEMTMA